MEKHMVTCVKCGRRFDANEGGRYYPQSRRYECKACADAQKRKQMEEYRAKHPDAAEAGGSAGKPGAAMVVKIVFGILFLLASFTLALQGNFAGFAVGLVVAAALVVWGLAPYLKNRK